MAGIRWSGALRAQRFRQLFLALILSSSGDWLGLVAITALTASLVDGLNQQSFAIAGVLVVRLLPAAVLGPLAGALADRFDRRRTMVVTDLLRALFFGSIPLVAVLADASIALIWLYVASLIVEALSLFWIPAKEASVPNLLPRRDLENANQLSLVATYGTAPLAALVFSGLGLLTKDAAVIALAVNAATFVFAAAQVSRIDLTPVDGPAPVHDPGEPQLSLLASIKEGLVFAGTSALVRGLLVGILGTLAATGAVVGLGRPFAESVLQGGDSAYGLLFAAVFVGIASGVGLGPLALGGFSRRRAFGLSIVLAGAFLVVLSLVPVLWVAALAVLLAGAFAGVAYVVGLTLLGGEVEDAVRGRTISLVQALMRVTLLGTLAASPLIAGTIGLRQVPLPGGGTLAVNGTAMVLLAGGVLTVVVGFASYRQMDDRKHVRLRTDLWSLVHRQHDRAPRLGLFVALEGGEGAGKSTQLAALQQWLEQGGHEVVVTREPGGTVEGERLRALLLDPGSDLSPRAEALLYAADRAQHVDQVVRPALLRGAVVLTDRFVDSSLAYQGAGRVLEGVADLSAWATQGLVPDLTVLLDVDPAVGLVRARRVGAPDRLEAESLAFHQRVRQGFLRLADGAPDRYLVLDASDAPETSTGAVQLRLVGMLPPVADVAEVGPADTPPVRA